MSSTPAFGHLPHGAHVTRQHHLITPSITKEWHAPYRLCSPHAKACPTAQASMAWCMHAARSGDHQLCSSALPHAGARCGAEKNLAVLKDWLVQLPSGTHLCFVGDGPALADLQQHFAGLPVTFTVSPGPRLPAQQLLWAVGFRKVATVWAIQWYLAAREAAGLLRCTLLKPRQAAETLGWATAPTPGWAFSQPALPGALAASSSTTSYSCTAQCSHSAAAGSSVRKLQGAVGPAAGCNAPGNSIYCFSSRASCAPQLIQNCCCRLPAHRRGLHVCLDLRHKLCRCLCWGLTLPISSSCFPCLCFKHSSCHAGFAGFRT